MGLFAHEIPYCMHVRAHPRENINRRLGGYWSSRLQGRIVQAGHLELALALVQVAYVGLEPMELHTCAYRYFAVVEHTLLPRAKRSPTAKTEGCNIAIWPLMPVAMGQRLAHSCHKHICACTRLSFAELNVPGHAGLKSIEGS
jgi:hypothetical protein